MLRGLVSLFRFLLENVEHIDHTRELNGVDRTIGIAVEILDNFENGRAAKTL